LLLPRVIDVISKRQLWIDQNYLIYWFNYKTELNIIDQLEFNPNNITLNQMQVRYNIDISINNII